MEVVTAKRVAWNLTKKAGVYKTEGTKNLGPEEAGRRYRGQE